MLEVMVVFCSYSLFVVYVICININFIMVIGKIKVLICGSNKKNVIMFVVISNVGNYYIIFFDNCI